MTEGYVVFDGSNIATEGRSIPSLAQLDEAVRAFMAERPGGELIVVVDASFGHRIEDHERTIFEQAEAAGEVVSPPAGALGRGDGFLLRIADRTGATVVSNDSFQEFHGEYKWLFDDGRLIGGKPVPGVGWIFTPRTPVRGPKSRVAVAAAKKATKTSKASKASDAAEPAAKSSRPRRRGRGRGADAVVAQAHAAEAIAAATVEALSPVGHGDGDGDSAEPAKRGRRRRRGPSGPRPEAVNEPLPFIQFIADHPLGTEVEGEVDGFTSHGAFVLVGAARCYVPLVGLGDPPPRSAKEVLRRGEPQTFVVQALDAPRRGIELALPGLARVAGEPTQETVEAEIGAAHRARASKRAAREPAKKAVAAEKATPRQATAAATTSATPPARKAAATKKAAKKASAAKSTIVAKAATKAPVAKAVKAGKAVKATKAAKGPAAAKSVVKAKKAPVKARAATTPAITAKKAPAKKAPAKKAPAKKAPAKKAPAKAEAAGTATSTKTAPAKKAATKKSAAAKTATPPVQRARSNPGNPRARQGRPTI